MTVGAIAPEQVMTPGIFVKRVVAVESRGERA